MSQKVFIKPVPRTSVLGITTKHSDFVPTVDINTGQSTLVAAQRSAIKKGRAKYTTLCFPTSWETGKFTVFKNISVPNPYYKQKNAEIPSEWLSHSSMLMNSQFISEQMFYELKHNVPPNTYTQDRRSIEKARKMLVRDSSKMLVVPHDMTHTYFETVFREFYDGVNILDLDIAEDELWYVAIKNSVGTFTSKFAINIDDVQLKPDALFYIVDEQLEDSKLLNDFALEDEARAKFSEFKQKLSPAERYQFAVLLNLTTTHAIKPEKVTMLVRNYIETGTRKETSTQRAESDVIYRTFINLYEEFISANTRSNFNAKYLIKEAVNTGVFRKKENEYIWVPNGDSSVAESLGREDSLIKKIKDPKNQDLVAEIKAQIESKGVIF